MECDGNYIYIHDTDSYQNIQQNLLDTGQLGPNVVYENTPDDRYGEFISQDVEPAPYGTYKIKVYPFSHLVIGVFFGIAIFMGALAWNFAVRNTLIYFFETAMIANAVSTRLLVVSWVYTLVLTGIILTVLFLFRRRIPPEVLKY